MTAPDVSVLTEISTLLPSFQRSMRAGNRSPKTVKTYSEAVGQLGAFLAERGMPTDAAKVRREHVEAFVEDLLERWKPATANNRYRALDQFFKWLVGEGEMGASPMANMAPPTVPEQLVPVVSDDVVRALLATCAGNHFDDRRDAAIIRLFVDSGLRCSELVSLRLDDVDLDLEVAVVLGKGARPRSSPFGGKTTQALDRYLRVRRRHRHAGASWLWLGARGQMTDSGVRQMLERRCDLAGVERIHPHQLRHTFAHTWLAEGGSEGDLMRLAGWKSRQMLQRYGASAADERARAAHQAMKLGDRI